MSKTTQNKKQYNDKSNNMLPNSKLNGIIIMVNKIMKTVNYNNMELNKICNDNWKKRSQKYLLALECFLDKAQSIKDENLKREIIMQMLKCDKELTDLAEEIFAEKYNIGIKDGQNNNKD